MEKKHGWSIILLVSTETISYLTNTKFVFVNYVQQTMLFTKQGLCQMPCMMNQASGLLLPVKARVQI